MKAMGPDNMCADLLKAHPEASSKLLSVISEICWTHQVAPTVWNRGYTRPIPKKSEDRRHPGNWRGLAMSSHIRKLHEVGVRELMRDKGLYQVHELQMGFQRRIGPIEAAGSLMSF
ncbi:hypothetical protein PBRA_008893 [Plasmodiophora brassicae]|uniref:Uncharacterized protein n=1 Tax=Plasmodiophora brassicae TaxID=37360 RepID=A0A0G4J4M2_PLABS|nr:hypothetical protein PBRA_008893 [Plasmodiophora brassicae]